MILTLVVKSVAYVFRAIPIITMEWSGVLHDKDIPVSMALNGSLA